MAVGKMSTLELRLADLLQHRKAHSKLRQLKSSPPNAIDFSSNDFLSLATTSALRQDFLTEVQDHIRPVGSTGSRLLDGNSEYAEALEKRIANFHGADTGLLTNSGFDANVSIFMCLPQPGDVIVYDELVHASVHDGMRQSRDTTKAAFKHNSIDDLTQVLTRYSHISRQQNVFVAVESLYSMDGDIAPLREIVSTMEETFPSGNCHLVVDEAHATGVYGPQGRGLVSALGLERRVSIRLHTFGKALACNGAIILCSDVIKQYLINYARPLIYTTFMSYPNLSAIKVVYDWLQTGRTESFAANLFQLISYMYSKLKELVPIITSDGRGLPVLTIPLHCPVSPILALMSPLPRQLAAHCQASGFIVRAVMPPTVPEGSQRVRVCLHAGNTFEQIDNFVGCVREWLIKQSSSSSFSSSSSSSPSSSSSSSSCPSLEVATDVGHPQYALQTVQTRQYFNKRSVSTTSSSHQQLLTFRKKPSESILSEINQTESAVINVLAKL